MVKYTTDSGMTGQAIRSNKVVWLDHGKVPQHYSNEVDNITKVNKVNNLVVVPVYFGQTLKAVI